MKEAITSTLNQQEYNNKMKLLLLKGFNYDPCEVERHAIANVFKTWSEVEVYLQAIIDDTRSVFTSYLDGDKIIQFTETLLRLNGNLVGYVCKLCLDMTNLEHRELYTGIIFDNWSTAKNYQWNENTNIRTHELTVASLWVKEVEI